MRREMWGMVALMLFVGLFPAMVTAQGGSFDDAEHIGEGTFSGEVSYFPEDVDFYCVSVPTGNSILVGFTSGSHSDVSLEIYDENKVSQSIGFSSDGEFGYAFYDGKSTSTYTAYLKFYGNGSYSFTVEFRPSDMQSMAIALSDGSVMQNVIKVDEEVHWYKISLEDRQGVNLSARATGDGIDVDFYNSQGDHVASNFLTSTTAFTITYATSNSDTIYIKVRSTDWSGYVDVTYTINVKIDSAPSPPRNLQATTDNEEVYLSWEPPINDGGAPILCYRIFRNEGDGWQELGTTEETNFTDDQFIVNGKTYRYRVTAVNWAGDSDFSNEVAATPMTTPSPPWLLQISSGDGYVELSWEPPFDDGGSPITAYRIYRGEAAEGESFLTEVDGNVTSYTDTDVVNGQTYYYYVTAVNEAGEGTRSEEVSTTPTNSFEDAEEIGEGTYSGTVDDEYYYKVDVPAYKAILVTLTAGDDADVSLRIYNSNRQDAGTIAMAENGETDKAFYDEKSSSAYVVYLKVKNYNIFSSTYTLSVEFRPGDVMSSATQLTDGQQLSGTLKASLEVHWYKIDVPKGKLLNVSYTSNGGDISIELYDSQGDWIDIGLGLGHAGGVDTELFGESGTIYIKVTSFEFEDRDISYTLTPHLKKGTSTAEKVAHGIATLCLVVIIIIILVVVLLVVIVVIVLRKKKGGSSTPPTAYQQPPPGNPPLGTYPTGQENEKHY